MLKSYSQKSPRPLLIPAAACALATIAVGLCVTCAIITTTNAAALGLDGWPLSWAFRGPFRCVSWLWVSTGAAMEAGRYHRAFDPYTSFIMGRVWTLVCYGTIVSVALAMIVYAIGWYWHTHPLESYVRAPASSRAAAKALPKLFKGTLPAEVPEPIGLRVGVSTGRLMELGHLTAVSRGRALILSLADACMNIMIYGGIGSGKTVCAINRLLRQCFRLKLGILLFDAKGDSHRTMVALAKEAGREVVFIGVGAKSRSINLLEGLTPQKAADYLLSAMILALGGKPDSTALYFVGSAKTLAEGALGIISFFPEHYSLYGLYQFLFKKKFKAKILEQTQTLLETFRKEASHERVYDLETYLEVDSEVFAMVTEDHKGGITYQLATVLQKFTRPEMIRAFCQPNADNINLRDVLDGTAFCVDLPLLDYGKAAMTAYMFIKLRFFDVMNGQRELPREQRKHVAFFCDEYQKLVSASKDGSSDSDFWDTSRDSGCIGIVSAQGVSSFRAAIGDDALTDSLLQNFRQRIVFRTEDEATIKSHVYILGEIEREAESKSSTRSTSSGIGRSSVSASQGTNVQQQMRHTINPQTIRQLGRGEAMAFLSIDGESYDDVLKMEPLIVTEPVAAEEVQ